MTLIPELNPYWYFSASKIARYLDPDINRWESPKMD